MENSSVNIAAATVLADHSRWRTLLDHFEDVLQINIFIIDPFGRILIPSAEQARFGANLLEETFGISFPKGESDFLSKFDPRGSYWERQDPFELSLFAVPIHSGEADPIFYLIIGPVRLSKKSWPDEKVLALAASLGLEKEALLTNIHAVSTMSQAALGAVLDLLSEVVRDVFELALEKQKFSVGSAESTVRPEIISQVKNLLADIQQDELTVSILDAAIKMSGAQGGSIMVYDEKKKEFVIKVSRGLEHKKSIANYRTKIGEGIAGVAAEQKRPLFISGTEGDSRIHHLLKRPDIKQSFVVPIVCDERVIAVLNLSIKDPLEKTAIEDIEQDIQKFSPLIAAALSCL